MMVTAIQVLAVGMVGAGGHATWVVPARLYGARVVGSAPRIDGRLDDPCWKALAPTSGFTRVLTAGGPAKAQTEARIGWDKTHLYVAMRCAEPKMAAVRRALVGMEPFRESVEVFVDTNLDRSTYAQFRVAVDGKTEWRTGYGPARHRGWQGKVALGKDAWTVEIAIDLRTLGVTPTRRTRWGFNLNRQRAVSDPMELSCWSNTGGGFHSPAKFGQLVFDPYAPWLKAMVEAAIRGKAREAQSLLRQYPRSTAPVRDAAQQFPTLLATAHKDIDRRAIQSEPDALKAFKALGDHVRRAQDLFARVRLAVIRGEFQ